MGSVVQRGTINYVWYFDVIVLYSVRVLQLGLGAIWARV